MNDKGYQVLIDNAYPYRFAFDRESALEIATRLNPKAVARIRRHYEKKQSEPFSASQLAHTLAACDSRNKRPRRERIDLIRQELSDYWETGRKRSVKKSIKSRHIISHIQ